MRRVGVAAMILAGAATGCSSLRDVFTSHAETAARVGNRELKATKVAEIITRLGGPNANPQAAELVAGIWVDLALFADRLAAGTFKGDSATLDRLMWPEMAQQKVTAWHDTIVSRRAGVTPAAADSAYAAGALRLFQHILFQAKGATAADTAKARALAEKVLPDARRGDFAKLAAQYSADNTKADGGYLPPSPKGAYVAPFDSAAWLLQPGQVSGVVRTQYGFHIIRRPPGDEIRDRLRDNLKLMQSGKADSIYMAELATRNGLTVKSGAGAAIRSAVADLYSARKSGKEIVAFKKGGFTVGEMVRWLEVLPPQQLQGVRQANDTLLEQFAKTLAQNTLLLQEADSAKIKVAPTLYQALVLQYKAGIQGLKEAIGLDGPDFSDSSKVAVSERRKLAERKVDEYFDKLTKGQAQFRPVPTTLSAELRSSGDFKIYQAGVSRAMELIIAQRKKDSAAGGGPRSPGSLQQAPGGPPVPGKSADTTKKP
jgi:PPIC-type peptidyl-prolyl cis-trans isomerase-like protein